MAPKSFPEYADWKGRVVRCGWESYHCQLWHVTRWSSGWSDWSSAKDHLDMLPFSYEEKLEVV